MDRLPPTENWQRPLANGVAFIRSKRLLRRLIFVPTVRYYRMSAMTLKRDCCFAQKSSSRRFKSRRRETLRFEPATSARNLRRISICIRVTQGGVPGSHAHASGATSCERPEPAIPIRCLCGRVGEVAGRRLLKSDSKLFGHCRSNQSAIDAKSPSMAHAWPACSPFNTRSAYSGTEMLEKGVNYSDPCRILATKAIDSQWSPSSVALSNVN